MIYTCEWETIRSPATAYYSGRIVVNAEDEDDAARRARRMVAARDCFSPGCIQITSIKPGNEHG
jgi:hypothetical protein